jgi:hydroxyacylglutathione hydrolase
MIKINHFTFNAFQENTYILSDETGECIIIDPGCYDAYEEQVLSSFIEKENLIPVKLMLTHSHIDHVLGNDFIFRRYGLKPEMHKLDLAGLQRVPEYGHVYGFKVAPSPEPVLFYDEGDQIKFGNSSLDVLFTPGHAPGHITLVNDEQKFIIAGDVLFYGSIGRTDLPGGDHATLIKSIKEKLLPLGDEYEVFCGHGPSTTIGFERKNNPFL